MFYVFSEQKNIMLRNISKSFSKKVIPSSDKKDETMKEATRRAMLKKCRFKLVPPSVFY